MTWPGWEAVATWLLGAPLRIVGVLLAAVVVRWLVHRAIRSLVDTAVARRSASIHVPDPRPVRDGLIAATALVHGLTLVTRNTSDFVPMAVPLLNPWL